MNKNSDVLKGAAAGLLGGLVASLVMNRFQAALSKLGEDGERSHGAQSQQSGSPDHGAGAFLVERGADDPDDDAAERTANLVAVGLLDRRLSESEKDIGGTIFHYAFGATSGALYGAVSELVPAARVGWGLPFGFAVWLIADEGVVPALGLSKSPAEYPIKTHAYALASHLVYGLATDVAQAIIRPRLS
ncbi:MAG TPA: DUF1440 domain-containing protein [Pyrinomonadaceae bacterium]|nr:DUF1440 domain-containing protein [Pyrinomonadaceae bacterium]